LKRSLILIVHPKQHLAAIQPQPDQRISSKAGKPIVHFSGNLVNTASIHAPCHEPIVQEQRSARFMQ
jgi:hypothetical protein